MTSYKTLMSETSHTTTTTTKQMYGNSDGNNIQIRLTLSSTVAWMLSSPLIFFSITCLLDNVPWPVL